VYRERDIETTVTGMKKSTQRREKLRSPDCLADPKPCNDPVTALRGFFVRNQHASNADNS